MICRSRLTHLILFGRCVASNIMCTRSIDGIWGSVVLPFQLCQPVGFARQLVSIARRLVVGVIVLSGATRIVGESIRDAAQRRGLVIHKTTRDSMRQHIVQTCRHNYWWYKYIHTQTYTHTEYCISAPYPKWNVRDASKPRRHRASTSQHTHITHYFITNALCNWFRQLAMHT